MSYIIGKIVEIGNIINPSYEQLAKLEVQYEGTDTWLDCSVASNISNKSNTSFTIRVKDGQIVTTMSDMFAKCSSLTSLDLSNFNTSEVTTMGYMFYNCKKLTSLDLSSFDTSNVTDMNYMFHDCKSLTSLDVSNFDTSKVTNMNAMFYNCNKLTSLDVSNFDTSKVTKMGYMFQNCSSLTSLDVSNWDIDLTVLTSYADMLVGASALKVINLSFANQDTISVIYNSVPSQAITVKTTPENVAYATDTAPSNVTVIDVISTIRISTTKQQLLYNILYGIQNANIVPQDVEELILYGIMMNQDVDVRLDTIVQILYYTLLKKGV